MIQSYKTSQTAEQNSIKQYVSFLSEDNSITKIFKAYMWYDTYGWGGECIQSGLK